VVLLTDRIDGVDSNKSCIARSKTNNRVIQDDIMKKHYKA
jgi:hypothetical protein